KASAPAAESVQAARSCRPSDQSLLTKASRRETMPARLNFAKPANTRSMVPPLAPVVRVPVCCRPQLTAGLARPVFGEIRMRNGFRAPRMLALVALGLVLAGGRTPALSIDELVAKHIAARGGLDALRAV